MSLPDSAFSDVVCVVCRSAQDAAQVPEVVASFPRGTLFLTAGPSRPSHGSVRHVSAAVRDGALIRHTAMATLDPSQWCLFVEPWERCLSLSPHRPGGASRLGVTVVSSGHVGIHTRMIKAGEMPWRGRWCESAGLPQHQVAVELLSLDARRSRPDLEAVRQWYRESPMSPDASRALCFAAADHGDVPLFLHSVRQHLFAHAGRHENDYLLLLALMLKAADGAVAPPDYDAAVTLVAGYPDRPESWCLMGDIYHGMGYRRQAVAAYEAALVVGRSRPLRFAWPASIDRTRAYPLAMLSRLRGVEVGHDGGAMFATNSSVETEVA